MRGIAQVGVHVRGENRAESLAALEPIRVGITGADAGLASTGTLVLRTNAVQSRLTSLLPPVHVAILRRERLFPTLESWLVAEGKTSLSDSRSVALVSGPSRTSDIEQQSVVGVHGPGKIYVVVL